MKIKIYWVLNLKDLDDTDEIYFEGNLNTITLNLNKSFQMGYRADHYEALWFQNNQNRLIIPIDSIIKFEIIDKEKPIKEFICKTFESRMEIANFNNIEKYLFEINPNFIEESEKYALSLI